MSSLNVARGNARGRSAQEDICRPTFRRCLGEAGKLLNRIDKTTRKRDSWLFLGLNSPGYQARDRGPQTCSGQQWFAEVGVPLRPHTQAERSEASRLQRASFREEKLLWPLIQGWIRTERCGLQGALRTKRGQALSQPRPEGWEGLWRSRSGHLKETQKQGQPYLRPALRGFALGPVTDTRMANISTAWVPKWI